MCQGQFIITDALFGCIVLFCFVAFTSNLYVDHIQACVFFKMRECMPYLVQRSIQIFIFPFSQEKQNKTSTMCLIQSSLLSQISGDFHSQMQLSASSLPYTSPQLLEQLFIGFKQLKYEREWEKTVFHFPQEEPGMFLPWTVHTQQILISCCLTVCSVKDSLENSKNSPHI